jgi:hypothetical protein
VPQGRKGCERLPVPVRRWSAQALSSRSPAWVRTKLVLAQVSAMKTRSMVHEEQGGRQRKIQVMSLRDARRTQAAMEPRYLCVSKT